MKRRLIALLGGLIQIPMTCPLPAAEPPPWKAAADEILAKVSIEDGPGGALGVVVNGELVYAEGFGFANLDYEIPNTADSVFGIASCTKQFTATAAILLAFDGKIDLDADIRTYLPELALRERVPVRRLMTHTSGLQDYSELQILGRGRDELHTYTPAQINHLVNATTSLTFQPGERELYSNTNYLLLARIIERVSGQSLREFAQERIFEPLGMTSTFFLDETREVVPRRATGYRRGGDAFITGLNAHAENLVGAGGVNSSVRDLAKWMTNFMSPSPALGGTRLIDELTRPGMLNDGTALRTGNGVMLGTMHSQRWVEHAGHSNVGNSLLSWWRDADVAFIVLTNLGDLNPWSISNPLLDPVLGEMLVRDESSDSTAPSPGESAAPAYLELGADEMQVYCGRYPADLPVGRDRPPHGGVGVVDIVVEDDQLVLRFQDGDVPLKVIDHDTLDAIGIGVPVKLRFENLGTSGQHFSFDNPTGHFRALPLVRIEEPDVATLDAFVGSYQAPELPGDAPIRITREGTRMFMHWGIRQVTREVFLVGRDRLTTYASDMQCNLVFTFDNDGRPDSFSYEGHRVWNLRFDRASTRSSQVPR